MARRKRSTSSDTPDVVREARSFLEERQGAEDTNRATFTEDLRFAFIPGEQWDKLALAKRLGRPNYSYNRVVGAINRAVGEQRMVHPRGKVRAVNKRSSVTTAEKLSGLIRDIEAQSFAEDVYDEAYKYCVAGGWGAWRVVPEYVDDESFDQALRIRRIRNPLTVFWDHLADPFGRGAERVIIAERISVESYKSKYGKDAWTNIPVSRDAEGWFDDDQVRIAEFYRVKFRDARLVLLSNGDVRIWDADLERELERARASGLSNVTIERERPIKRRIVEWAKVDGHQVLEGPIEYQYDHIPVIRLPGRHINIEGRDYFQSLHLHAKDSQRTYNYNRSTMVELVALQPRAPYLGTARMFEGYEDWWKQANTSNAPYLPFNPDPDSKLEHPKREAGPEVPQAYALLVMHDAEDIKHTTGYSNPALEQQTQAGDAESGVAFRSRMAAGDAGSYEYLDNLGKAIMFTHAVIISMIPQHYDTPRVERILGPDGREEFVDLDPDELRKAKFDVTVTLGPSYATSRMESLDTLLGAAERIPVIGEEAPDIIVRNLDVQGADELSERVRMRLIREGRIQPTEEEAQKLPPPPPPDPTQVALAARLEAQAERDRATAMRTTVQAADMAASAGSAERREELELRQLAEQIQNTHAQTLAVLAEIRNMFRQPRIEP